MPHDWDAPVTEVLNLEHIKAKQDKAAPKKRRAGKQAIHYQPTGRRNTEGLNSKLAKRAKKKVRHLQHMPQNNGTGMAVQGCDI